MSIDKELAYQQGLETYSRTEEQGRAKVLIQAAAAVLRHFFDHGPYAIEPPQHLKPGDYLPTIWPYVRYLIFDYLRPQFGLGPSLFVHERWNDVFLQSLATEAKAAATLLPKNLTNLEWRFMVSVSGYMLMANPLLQDLGFVTENGAQQLVIRAFEAGFDGKDLYEDKFLYWKSVNQGERE